MHWRAARSPETDLACYADAIQCMYAVLRHINTYDPASQALAAAAAEQARLAKHALEERARAAAEQKRLADQVRPGLHIRQPNCRCTPADAVSLSWLCMF